MKKLIVLSLLLTMTIFARADDYFAPGKNNPVIPGFFADPSIVQMDDKYYIYATTVSKYMEPMVWVSEDLQNWDVKPLNICGENLFWAPSMIKGGDGKYYLYYSSGFDFKCHLYIGDSPTGPFEKFGKVEEGFDLQIFKDPNNGKIYGTSSNPESRPRLVEFVSNPDDPGYMTDVIKEQSLKGPFFDYTEGSFIVFKDGWYYLMYSGGKCGAENYKINYAVSKNIWGPYQDGENSPILKKDPAKNIFGPGHHSIFNIGEEYFIVYHRQDYYHYPTCSERQICIDRIEFTGDGKIEKVVPTNKGVDFGQIIPGKKSELTNVAIGKKVAAGGVKKSYNPEFAVDNNYATRWIGSDYLSVDLNKIYTVEKIVPRFVQYDYFNLYKILYSSDNQNWKVYADHSRIARKAYTNINHKTINARYIKIKFIRGEGDNAGLFELEIYGK